MFPFGKIFKQALSLTKNNRFLWPYGLFLLSVVFYVWAKPNLIAAIKALLDKQRKKPAQHYILVALLSVASVVFLWFVYTWSLPAFIPILLFIFGFIELTLLFVILHDLKIVDSISASLSLWVRYWPVLCVLSLVLLVVSAFFPSLALVVFFRFYGNISMALMALFFLLLASVPVVFSQVCWVLAFQELIKPIKLEEGTEAAILPEVAS